MQMTKEQLHPGLQLCYKEGHLRFGETRTVDRLDGQELWFTNKRGRFISDVLAEMEPVIIEKNRAYIVSKLDLDN